PVSSPFLSEVPGEWRLPLLLFVVASYGGAICVQVQGIDLWYATFYLSFLLLTYITTYTTI
ncbi:MAG: hypothetical protein ACI8RD_013252, partial [Bacillariaceae sp.]